MNANPSRLEIEPGITWPLTLDAVELGDWVACWGAPYGGFVVKRGTYTKLDIPAFVLRSPGSEPQERCVPVSMCRIVGILDPDLVAEYQREHGGVE